MATSLDTCGYLSGCQNLLLQPWALLYHSSWNFKNSALSLLASWKEFCAKIIRTITTTKNFEDNSECIFFYVNTQQNKIFLCAMVSLTTFTSSPFRVLGSLRLPLGCHPAGLAVVSGTEWTYYSGQRARKWRWEGRGQSEKCYWLVREEIQHSREERLWWRCLEKDLQEATTIWSPEPHVWFLEKP